MICVYIVSRNQKQFYIYLSIVIILKNFGNLYVDVIKYKYKDKYGFKMYFIFISGESKLGNYLLAVAKHYIYKNKFSDKQLNINSFILMLKVKFQCESFIANINNKMSKFLSRWTPFYKYFNKNQDQKSYTRNKNK